MFKNTIKFSEAAEHFKKYGTYCEDPPDTIGYDKYWDEQERRCKEGYTVDGVRITGPHYFYLNFCQIRLTDSEKIKEAKEKRDITKRGKSVDFPRFWDGDYEYFHTVETTRLNGEHVIVDKCRRRGYSYKNAALACYDYTFIRNSFTIIGAFEKKYLYPNGTMAMVNNYMNFLNKHTAWSKRRDEINRIDHKRASYVLTDANGVTTTGGYMSEVMAITYKDNPDAARGKDATLILLEEGGKFDNLKASFLATKPCVEDGNQTVGQIIVFGTGGDMEGGSIDFSEMFYDPKPYNFAQFENIWDEAALGTYCGYFVPDYMNKEGFIDAEGNSDKLGALEYENNKRETIKKAKDPTVLTRHLSEYPFCPAESFLVTNVNILPIAQIQMQEKKLMTDPMLSSIGTPGKFVRKDGYLTFLPDYNLKPVNDFPAKAETDITGCPVIYFEPYRVGGEVPSGLYYIGHDPYAQDGTGGLSLGAAYVLCRPNKFIQPDDIIVAEYVGRPASQDEYNRILFDLAEYYNAKIGFENDRGEVKQYATRQKRLHQLQEEFQMLSNKELQSSTVNRGYGMHMTDRRKEQGEVYLRDWLNTVVSRTSDGRVITNVDRIYSIALCRELVRFNKKKGNFDRVMALLVAMYHSVELYDKEIVEPNSRSEIDRYFEENYIDDDYGDF